MADIAGVRTDLNNNVIVVSWENITENDTGVGMGIADWPDRTVQAVGDFTSSGAITMEGSNDGTNYGALHDPQGVAIVLTDSVPRVIAENMLYIRPRATAGSAVSIDVIVTAVK